MTAHSESARRIRPSSPRSPLRRLARRGVSADTQALVLLCLVGFVIVMLVVIAPTITPFTSLMVPLLLGHLFLNPRKLPWFVVYIMVLVLLAISQQASISVRTVIAVSIQFLMGLIILLASFRRSRLGVGGSLGESMFVDLRDRILNQGGIPELPGGWQVESALRSAGGTPFAGDFVVATRPSNERLEVVVVDVSGKGEQAGTRALLLSGAFGGLLTALPPGQFLPAANAYLLRQDWEEGFATAVHFSLHLDTGAYEIRTAGHPPAALRAAGSGRWTVLQTEGPVLGLIPEAEFSCAAGLLSRGDAVLLYTDGMVEEPHVDIELGIDRMLGEAERLLRGNAKGLTRKLVAALGSSDDDSAMVLVTRA